MPAYTPPLRDMQFVMHEVLNVTEELKALPKHAEVDAETINAVLEEGGKFASEVTFPLNINGDEEGCVLDKTTHEVKTPKGFKDAYAQYVEGGWAALSLRSGLRRPGPAVRGQPVLLRDAQLGQPGLDDVPGPVARRLRGPARARHRRAEEDLPAQAHQRRMDRHHVPDRSRIAAPTSACCAPRPSRRPTAPTSITGNKIFISAGEHDMAANIIHLVLARLPDAPKGSKGISLFVVPKFNVKADGSLGEPQRHLLRRPRAQDGHPRQRHRADRARRRHRHAGRPAQQGPGRDVRDDERRPPGRRQPVAGPDRSGVPERAGLRQGPHPDALAVRREGQGQGRPTRSSCTPTCARCC